MTRTTFKSTHQTSPPASSESPLQASLENSLLASPRASLQASLQASLLASLEKSWRRELGREIEEPYFRELCAFLKSEIQDGKRIYPQPSDWFAAFRHTPFEQVRVVILGQDPYHGPDQAHGLSFSVRPGVRPPPSLVNIFKELKSDLRVDRSSQGSLAQGSLAQGSLAQGSLAHGSLAHGSLAQGCLESWANQGVLLLNSVLTVRDGEPASHQGRGWERFTDKVIHVIASKQEPLVFVLWGAYAQKKGRFINRARHLVIEGPHPSPLSASRGFLGSKPFSRINAFLEDCGQKPIDWSLP
jgi:uracil-DNA glycosylase